MFRQLSLIAIVIMMTILQCNVCYSFQGITVTSTKHYSTATSTLHMTKLVYNGKEKDFPPGSPLSKAAAQLGVKVKYSCKKGDCATCQIRLAGSTIKCCTGKVPPEPRLKSLQEKGLEIRI